MYRIGRGGRRVLLPLLITAISCLGARSFAAGPLASARIPNNLSPSQVRLSQFPKIILWAWERPEDLHFINPREVGVAFLAETIYFRGGEVTIRPRLQPLKIPPGTFLMATVRIESIQSPRKLGLHVYSPVQRAQAVASIADLAYMKEVRAVQIDFDATESERDFYRDLLDDVRRQLPDSTALSITALGSWCEGDRWMDGLPIDEAVPMLFRMGPDRRKILDMLRHGHKFAAPICNQSLGISTDEPLPKMPRGRRVYIFHPGAWSQEAMRAAVGGNAK